MRATLVGRLVGAYEYDYDFQDRQDPGRRVRGTAYSVTVQEALDQMPTRIKFKGDRARDNYEACIAAAGGLHGPVVIVCDPEAEDGKGVARFLELQDSLPAMSGTGSGQAV